MKKFIVLIICLLMPLSLSLPCKALEAPIKVAYFSLGNYYNLDENQNVISYDKEYLDEISKYTGLTFEYVDCKTWNNALKMLENHEIDLAGTAQWTEDRDSRYEYTLQNYGYTIGELAVLPDNEMVYEDYEAIGKSIVGCVENYVHIEDMNKVFAEHQIAPQIKMYANQQQLETAFKRGEVTIIAANSHTFYDDWIPVEKFSYSPFYFISWKGNSKLTSKLNDAIIKINMDEPNFDDQLTDEYFPILTHSPLSKAELNLIEQNKLYTIYFDDKTRPLSWYDEKTGTLKGTLIDICKQVAKKTGLRIQFRQRDNNSIFKGTDFLVNNIVIKPGKVSAGVTDPLIEEAYNLYHRENEHYSAKKSYKIALVKNREVLQSFIEKNYPNCQIVTYDSPLTCLEQVSKGKADLTFLNVHIADNILITENINNVKELPIAETDFGIGLQFYGENQELLTSIVNKGLKAIDYNIINEALLQYSLNTTPRITLYYLIQENMGVFIGLVVFFVLVLIALAILITYIGVVRKQRDRVAQADRDRSDFFARMSHDMRTPMNGVLGMIELTEAATDMNDVKENMVKAKAAGKYMLSLINDILDLQRLESGRLNIEPQVVKSGGFVNNMLEMVSVSARQKGIDLRLTNINADLDKYIKIDIVRVKQIFNNLLSNAIKFTPEGGKVEVILETIGHAGKIIYNKITIKDTGVGMSPEFIDKNIFKAYAQEHNQMSDNYAGSGLGLAIIKNLVDLMKGQISVTSTLGKGTTFTVYLDIEQVDVEDVEIKQQEQVQQNNLNKSNLAHKRILLCEDHPLNAEITQRLLEKVGCEVVWVKDGKQGMQAFSQSGQNYYDIILMDIRMPVMDGLEATREIRKLDRGDAKTIPIIAMTANAYESDRQESFAAGMNEHVAKPIDPKALYETLAKYC